MLTNSMIKTTETDDEEVNVNPAMTPKLTKWVNEPSVRELKEDLEAARPAHDTYIAKVRRWSDLTKVEGKAKPPKIKGRSQVQPKLVRRQAEWRYAALSEPFNSSDKMFAVSPSTFEDAEAARQNELVLNWQFRSKINRVNFIDNYVRGCVDEGSVIVRLGWSRITKMVTETVPVWAYYEPTDVSQIEQLEAAIQLKQQNPRAFNEGVDEAIQEAVRYFEETGLPTIAVQEGEQEIEVEKVIDNRPLLETVNPENVYFDPTCGDDLDKANFVVVTFETCKADLLKEPKRYKNLKYVNWEGATPVGDPNHAPQSTDINFNFKDSARKRVVAHEYWGLYDIHDTGELVPIVATWIGDTLVRLEENPFPDGKPPFVVATYMPIKRELLGEPDAELLEDNQKILGAVSRGMIDLLGRSANGQQGFAKGMLDVINRRRYESGQDYEFNPNMPPQQGIIEHKYPEIPQSALVMLQMQNQEAEALTGVKAFSGGISGEAFGEVAAGIRGALDAASKREMGILRRLAMGMVRIGKKIISMNLEFLSEEEVVRMTNEEFITVRREELATAAELDLKVDISTAEIDNNKAQDLAFMLQTLGNNMDFSITQMILSEIAELKRMPALANRIRQYQPQPDPITEALKKAELEKLQAEIEEIRSKTELNRAKAVTEEVEAEQAALDTVEQETGTKHARDMEKQTAQSTGNQNLEVTKALLKPRKPDEKDPEIEAALGYNELSKQQNDVRANNIIDPASISARNAAAQTDPRYSIGSKEFDPTLDPALNPAINI